MFSLSSPPVQSGLIPLVAAFVLVGLIHLIGGPGRGSALAGLGLALAVLASYWATLRIPAFPPVGATNKLFYIVLLATALGFVADLAGRQGWPGRAVALLAGPFGALWVGAASGLDSHVPNGVAVLVIVAATGAAGWVLHGLAERSSQVGAAILVLALALSACAILSNVASSAQLAGGLAAATGGFLLWNWPRARFPFNHAALAAALSLTGGLATLLALFTPKFESYALLPLVAIPFLIAPAAKLARGNSLPAKGMRPVVVALLCAVPAATAVLIVYLITPESSTYPSY